MEETSKILLSVQEFAKITGLGEKSIRRLSHVQGFPAIRIGHRIMIHKRSRRGLAGYLRRTSGRVPALH